jgi:hypothetical protein
MVVLENNVNNVLKSRKHFIQHGWRGKSSRTVHRVSELVRESGVRDQVHELEHDKILKIVHELITSS